jgi:hypothetical protein
VRGDWALGGGALGVMVRGLSPVTLLRHLQGVYPPEQVVLGPANGTAAVAFAPQSLAGIRVFGVPHILADVG